MKSINITVRYIFIIMCLGTMNYSCSDSIITEEISTSSSPQKDINYSSEIMKYNEGDMFYGFSSQLFEYAKLKLNHEKLYSKPCEGIFKDQNRVCSISTYNNRCGIKDKICKFGAARFGELIDWIKYINPEEISSIKSSADTVKPYLVKWMNFLKENIDYIDVRNDIKDERFIKDPITLFDSKIVKNFTYYLGGLNQSKKLHLCKALMDWATCPEKIREYNCSTEEKIDDWLWTAFFRKTSKLGLDFAKKNNLNIYFTTGTDEDKYTLFKNHYSRGFKTKKHQEYFPITNSEFRHCLRKNYFQENFIQLVPFAKALKEDVSSLKSFPLSEIGQFNPKKLEITNHPTSI